MWAHILFVILIVISIWQDGYGGDDHCGGP